ncbi:hypothetical protein Pan14r_09060 [Crateriforma conspicua]|uniref:Uncharacterized protein n=1 Tax=Crateriforma conspicua TaxID=2527996 RepID=A0A5C5Y1F8_9PLAN|nr:hypothetical protein Pan14r_09060 [Crateriforma conspicua]
MRYQDITSIGKVTIGSCIALYVNKTTNSVNPPRDHQCNHRACRFWVAMTPRTAIVVAAKPISQVLQASKVKASGAFPASMIGTHGTDKPTTPKS